MKGMRSPAINGKLLHLELLITPSISILDVRDLYQNKDAMKFIPRGTEQITPLKPEIYNLLNALLSPQEMKTSRIRPSKQPTRPIAIVRP